MVNSHNLLHEHNTILRKYTCKANLYVFEKILQKLCMIQHRTHSCFARLVYMYIILPSQLYPSIPNTNEKVSLPSRLKWEAASTHQNRFVGSSYLLKEPVSSKNWLTGDGGTEPTCTLWLKQISFIFSFAKCLQHDEQESTEYHLSWCNAVQFFKLYNYENMGYCTNLTTETGTISFHLHQQ